MQNIYEIVNKLIGQTKPIGETNADNESYENLKVLTELVDKLLTDIDSIAYQNKNRVEFSMNRSGEHCDKFLTCIGIVE